MFNILRDYYENSYYITLARPVFSVDDAVATSINLNLLDYKSKMLNDFNAYLSFKRIYFKLFADAEKARDWIESIYITIKLTK